MKKEKSDVLRPSFYPGDQEIFSGTKLCRSCNMGQRYSILEGSIKLLGTNDDDPNVELKIFICPRCGNTILNVTNQLQLKYSYSQWIKKQTHLQFLKKLSAK